MLILGLLSLSLFGQNKGVEINFSAGTTMPVGRYAKETRPSVSEEFPTGAKLTQYYGYTKSRKGTSQFNLDVDYFFGKFGIGLSVGQFKHQIAGLKYDISMPVGFEGGNIGGFYYGIGPVYKAGIGKFTVDFTARTGMMKPDYTNFTGYYNGEDLPAPIPVLITEPAPESGTSLLYGSFGVRLSYPLSGKLSLFTKVDYLTGLGNKFKVADTYYLPVDYNRDQEINGFEASHFTQIDYKREEIRTLKPKMLNIGIGLTYTVGRKHAGKTFEKKHFAAKKSIKPIKREKRKILLITPENGAQFNEHKNLKNFQWKVVGKPFENPTYIIEVRELKARGRIFLARTKKNTVTAQEIFKDYKPSGQYIWRVIEQNTGESSDKETFIMTHCDVNLSIDNTEIECEGYEGENRKYKICFDVTYSSSVGDLTYNNSGSGLMVYDQNYNSLSYNLTGTNTSLQTQTGSPQSTVHYCFETTVDPSVTSIGFGLQGDDLDPSPIICQPGVSNDVDELPDCLCDECDSIRITMANINISQQTPGVYTFDGNINVNVPVYGVELQLIYYNYSANPGTCSTGVNSVETSGMFLQNGTSINNSTSIQFINESASQSANSNTHASKDIVYTSSGPLTGGIPVHLNIGLPEPLTGMDGGCCQIDYQVCFKVKVFYEDGTCKTCYTTQCFNFNNQ